MLGSHRLRPACVACLVLAFLSLLRPASAQEAASAAPPPAAAKPPLEIEWQGPDDCARGESVHTKVLRLLGGGQQALTTPVHVSVSVRHEKARFVAELSTSSGVGGGTKRLEGESCDAIALACAVVIALSIDPNASLDAEPPPPPEAPKLKPRPVRRTPPPPRKAPEPPRETKPYLFGSIGVQFQLLSQPSAFTAGGVGVRHRRFSLELGGAVYQTRDVRRADKPRLGAELRLATGELLGCYAALPFSLGAVELCPGFRLEYLQASAFGASNPDAAGVLLGAGVGVLRGRLRATSWLSATFDAGVAARPFHPTFVLVGVGDVYEIPVFSTLARTGLVLEF